MLNTPLYKFQKEGVRRLLDLDLRALLGDDLGLGKTFQALYCAWRFLPDDPPGPIVVTVPGHLKIVWSREAEKHLDMRVEVLSGQRVPPSKLPPADPNQCYVVNYDILTPPRWRKGHAVPRDSWLYYLARLRPRMVIADEIHEAKTPGTARHRALKVFSQCTPHFLGLSGTPLENKPKDLWGILNLVRPELFPSETQFLERYTNLVWRWWGWEAKGAQNLDELNEILTSKVMVRRRKCEVLSELPPVQYDVKPLPVDLREYNKAEADYVGWLATKSVQKALRAARAEEMARMNGLKHLAGKLKVAAVIDWVRNLLNETGGKLLLGAVHRDVTAPIMHAFGGRAVLVDGSMGHEQKQAAFDRFNTSARCDLCVANLEAGGAGWSCSSTSDVALAELPWVPSAVEQFAGRAHGIGRGVPGHNTHCRLLTAAFTIDDDLCDLLCEKRQWASLALDGIDGSAEFDIRSRLRERMMLRHGDNS